MIDKNHIDAATSAHVSNILVEDPEPGARATAKETIDYYTSNFPHVQIVRCDGCGKDLCLEVLDPQAFDKYVHSHHDGLRRIMLENSPLLSSRKRLDGVMGYECLCGNNTINSTVELGLLPTVNNATGPSMIPDIEPHHVAMVAIQIAKTHYKPDVKVTGNKTRIETFTVERIA